MARGSRNRCGPWRRGQLPGLLQEVLSPDKIASISPPETGPSSKAKTVGGATRDPGNEEGSGVGKEAGSLQETSRKGG